MFEVGKTYKTGFGSTVEIIAILDKPQTDGQTIIGVKTGHDGEREVVTYWPNGRFMSSTKTSGSDLIAPPQIETRGVWPPIPDRRCDYVAWYTDADDEFGPRGWGPTPDEAIADLKDSYPRDEEPIMQAAE